MKSRELNFTNHYLKIKIEGYKLDRIITYGIDKNLLMRQVKYIDDTTIVMEISHNDYLKLKKIIKSKFKVTILEEKGIKFKAKEILKHKITIVGILIFAIILVAQNMFVTEINIMGYKKIPEEDIRQVLRQSGLYEGCYKKFDCTELERILYDEFDNIAWAKVAYEGRYVEVAITENNNIAIKEIPKDQPCDIIAERDCYIRKIKTFEGEAVVSEGDYVKKGKTIISGKVPIESTAYGTEAEKMKEYYVHASGQIEATVPYYKTFAIEKEKLEKNYTEKDLRKVANAQVRQWINKKMPEKAQILNKSLKFVTEKNIIEVIAVIEILQKIGIEQEIAIGKDHGRTEKSKN